MFVMSSSSGANDEAPPTIPSKQTFPVKFSIIFFDEGELSPASFFNEMVKTKVNLH